MQDERQEREARARIAALVARVRGGEREAFRELFALVERHAYALAVAHLRNAEDARDVVQDAALESYRGIAALQDPERFPAWVCGIVRFLCYRRLRRQRPVSLDALPYEPAQSPAEPEREPDPGISRALGALHPRYREVLVLRHLEGKTYEEIAELLDLTVAGVDSRLTRARALLRSKLKRLEGIVR